MIKLENINKSFYKKKEEITIFKNMCFNFESNKVYAIIGKSSSGKTTLIHILGLLDTFDSGIYSIDNTTIATLNDSELSKIRKEKIGLIFQDYYLNPRLTARENVLIAAYLNTKISKEQREAKVREILKKLNLENRINHYPNELSGGEQQRVCIARALINDPKYILADEPTGALDNENSKIIMEKLLNLKKENKCVIIVTHDLNVAKRADEILELKNFNLEKK